MKQNSIVIVGGGLAGLVAAIDLSKKKYDVTLIEKNEFPKHKVCGEYISNEVVPYLKSLGLDIASLNPSQIDKLVFSLVSGKTIKADLPLGGFGISRFKLDHYLYQQAVKLGCKFVKETVTDIIFWDNSFTITTNSNVFNASIVLGGFGKRSNLDIQFKRDFIQKKSHWLGVKAHYKVDFPDNYVGLHHFKGGYCGVSKIEDNLVNICYLANFETFKLFKSFEDYQENVLCENPNLNVIFKNAVLQFEKPLSISQVSFQEKKCIENHILMIGDAAGLIHPLCGNGMAMAIHSAKLAAENVAYFLENRINRNTLETNYAADWNKNFKKRLQTGRLLGKLLEHEKIPQLVMKILIVFPTLLPLLITKTHGKPL